jgi:hypothetical protein
MREIGFVLHKNFSLINHEWTRINSDTRHRTPEARLKTFGIIDADCADFTDSFLTLIHRAQVNADLHCFDVIFGIKEGCGSCPDCPNRVSLALFCKKKFFCRALSTNVETVVFLHEFSRIPSTMLRTDDTKDLATEGTETTENFIRHGSTLINTVLFRQDNKIDEMFFTMKGMKNTKNAWRPWYDPGICKIESPDKHRWSYRFNVSICLDFVLDQVNLNTNYWILLFGDAPPAGRWAKYSLVASNEAKRDGRQRMSLLHFFMLPMLTFH